MTKGPIRRTQLIAPFGVGAMVVVRDGISLIACGLDHWYKREEDEAAIDPDINEYKIDEWRLQSRLGVSHFRLPPDYRVNKYGGEVPNQRLTIPFLRFPRWHFCPFCGLLSSPPLTEKTINLTCRECESERKYKRRIVQVPFVAACDQGHLQDFPFREWVHRSSNPTCKSPMRLKGRGMATLSGQVVECDCGESRDLGRIVEGNSNSSFVSENLQDGTFYSCRGVKPWLGTDEPSECTRPLRGSLRSASNIYYAHVKSAIYLPRGNSASIQEIVSLFNSPYFKPILDVYKQLGETPTVQKIRSIDSIDISQYDDRDVEKALESYYESKNQTSTLQAVSYDGDDEETTFRRLEYDTLLSDRDDYDLKIRGGDVKNYSKLISTYFSKIMLVDCLRETRALTGFSRIFSESGQSQQQLKSLLWRNPSNNNTWLPAYIVKGEGIFLEFCEEQIRSWENDRRVINRVDPCIEKINRLRVERGLEPRVITARFFLIHTLSHLLMNQLTFECGYGSASLRERLYISSNQDAPMSGVLIYTASGDSEGTMGGLVRMGKPGRFEDVLTKSLESAKWCSVDPVCMEMGNSGGQGPNSVNLAACHNCSLLPETSCEEFNAIMDRGMVVGTLDDPTMGYFKI